MSDTDKKVDQYIRENKSTGFDQVKWNAVKSTMPENEQADAERRVHAGFR